MFRFSGSPLKGGLRRHRRTSQTEREGQDNARADRVEPQPDAAARLRRPRQLTRRARRRALTTKNDEPGGDDRRKGTTARQPLGNHRLNPRRQEFTQLRRTPGPSTARRAVPSAPQGAFTRAPSPQSPWAAITCALLRWGVIHPFGAWFDPLPASGLDGLFRPEAAMQDSRKVYRMKSDPVPPCATCGGLDYHDAS